MITWVIHAVNDHGIHHIYLFNIVKNTLWDVSAFRAGSTGRTAVTK